MNIYRVDPEEPAIDAIIAAVEALRAGDLVILPTETVYGLACDAKNEDAVDKIFRAKGRDFSSALPIQVADASQLRMAAEEVPEAAIKAASRFWPGPLTMVFKKRRGEFNAVAAGGDTIAIRIPRHAVPLAVLEEFDAPLAVTSANISGQPETVTADDAIASVGDFVSVVIDAGPAQIGQASTVLDVTGECPKILRQGTITAQEIIEVIGCEVVY